MAIMKPVQLFLLALAASMLSAGLANAHDDKHAARETIDYSKAEEMPFGIAADPKRTSRTVHIEMDDAMRFSPAELKVRRGDRVRFVITNKGKQMHEMVLGTLDDLKQHSELMKKHPGMEHDEAHMVHVAPGKTDKMGWRFTRAGTFYYGCLVPGHFEAGMIGKIVVE
jgi:uncharacterized cupredoxin-like copper-binding protein